MLTLRDLKKSFGATVAVDGLSLSLRPGEVFGLLGPNGAGKSTTINMAVGLLRPDSGSVSLEGVGDPTSAAARARIGVCPQALAVYDELSGAENLRFFGSMYGLAGPRLAARVEELLRLVGLSDRAADRVTTYSGGMKRRLNVAAALVHDPPLIMMDEPTVGVDPQSRNALYEIVLGLKASGRTILYTTHYMGEAERLCDRVGIIDRGKLLALDTVPALIARHGGKSVVIVQRAADDGQTTDERIETDDPVAVVQRELARGDSAGAGGAGGAGAARGLQIERPSLELVFLNLTGRTLRD